MRHSIIAAIALPIALPAALLLGASALSAQSQRAAAPQLPGTASTAAISGGTYQADANHTLVGWRVNHFGFNDYFGQFGQATGTLVLDKARPAASTIDITIPVASLTTSADRLTAHLQTPDFLDAAQFPTARFVSRRVTVNRPRATILGDLTLHGVTRPVTINAQFIGAGTNPMNRKETVGFHGTLSIKRSDFGVLYALPIVSDTVDLTISAAFEK